MTLQQKLQLIQQQHRLGIMTHVVIGYPSLAETEQRVLRMVDAGVDIIELQLPFSDPLADGPAITLANQVAVAAGITINDCLALATRLSQQVDIPLQFIGYYNTVLHYGVKRFVQASAAAGMQALTLPDANFDEEPYEHIYALTKQYHLPLIQLIAPTTTPKRLQRLAQVAEGYVYCQARTGITGTTSTIDSGLIHYLQTVRQYVTLPLAVGFGIHQREQLQALRSYADIAVIGSALLKVDTNQLTDYLKNLCA